MQNMSSDMERIGKELTHNVGKVLDIVSHGQETTSIEEILT